MIYTRPIYLCAMPSICLSPFSVFVVPFEAKFFEADALFLFAQHLAYWGSYQKEKEKLVVGWGGKRIKSFYD